MKPSKPPIHAVFYGDPGTQKSTCLATFPKPIWIALFDPIGKDIPYTRLGKTTPTEGVTTQKGFHTLGKSLSGDPLGYPYLDVFKNDSLQIRIARFHNNNLDKTANAIQRFRLAMSQIQAEVESNIWATVGFDSCTAAQRQALIEQRYRIAPVVVNRQTGDDDAEAAEAKMPRWRGNVTQQLEDYFITGASGLDCNVVLIAHTQEERLNTYAKDPNERRQKVGRVEMHDEMLRGIAAPGRLGRANGLTAAYQEVYRFFYAEVADQPSPVVRVQTTGDGDWIAFSQINAPNLCAPRYSALTKNV